MKATSTIDRSDVYGNSETWTVATYRAEGQETVFLQRIDATGSVRLVLPPEVTEALSRQRGRATTANRKRGARKAIATKLAEGQEVGNPAALAKARKARRTRRKRT